MGIGPMYLEPQNCFAGDPIYQTCWEALFSITPTPSESGTYTYVNGLVTLEPTQVSSAGTYQIDIEAQYQGT